jgi:hypothetical protein
MTLHRTIESIPLIDNHAHGVRPFGEDLTPEEFASRFTEGGPSPHARHTLYYRNALEFLKEYFDVETEAAVVEKRAAVEFDTFARDLFDRANISHILQDTGTPPDSSPRTLGRYTDADVRPVLRVENEVERLIGAHEGFSRFVRELRELLVDAVTEDHVGLKSIVAYRTGLDVSNPSRSEAAMAFHEVKRDWSGRLEHPVLLDFTAHLAAEVAGENDVPIQFHSGFGDADAHPRYVDPGYLWEFMNQHPETDIVLLHASYPYARTAGYIVSVLENVYLDIGMTIPFIQHGVGPLLRQVLELAPSTKIMYSSDGHYVPEWHYFGAERIRADLAVTLEELIEDGFVTPDYAETIARNMLRENAERVYSL